jgi:hypothetical protein
VEISGKFHNNYQRIRLLELEIFRIVIKIIKKFKKKIYIYIYIGKEKIIIVEFK